MINTASYSQNPASLPALTDRLKLVWDSMVKARAYAKARKEGAELTAIKDIVEMQEVPWTQPFPAHPNHDADLKRFTAQIESKAWPAGYDGTIGLGASIEAFSAAHLTSLDPLVNFAEPGGAGLNMLTLATELVPVLTSVQFEINFSLEGCFWGNAMLGHQALNSCIEDVKYSFTGIRKALGPKTRRIIYSAPRVYDLYANLNRPVLDQLMIDLVIADGNAVYVDLTAGTAGFLGILPKGWATAEGVHLSDAMFPIFDRRVIIGKTAPAGSIIRN